MTPPVDLRRQLARSVRSRVIGPRGARRAHELATASGERWFGQDRPVHRVHADASMFVGGLRALLLQSLHPLAMVGVAEHSDYRRDPWGRLQRTADFLATTTYGTAEQAEAAVRRVRAVHERVRGTAPDGRPYAANDPHLMAWIHLAEADSFLRAYQAFGAAKLSPGDADAYVADLARVARHLGVPDPPTDTASLRRQIDEFRPELRSTSQARDAARFLLLPPLPLVARGPYGVLYAAASSLLPWWARLNLWLPPFTPITDRAVVRPAASVLVEVLRWALHGDGGDGSGDDEPGNEPVPA